MKEALDPHDLDTARRIRDAGVRCLLDAYRDAGLRGLCGTGRFEVAVGALKQMDIEAVLHEEDAGERPAGSR
jgi:hypothetical protein